MPRMKLVFAAAVLAVLAVPAAAKEPPKPLPDWPCPSPFAGPLESEMLWPGEAGPWPQDGAWEADPTAHKLVNFLTAGENSPNMGRQEIESFVQENGPLKRETTLLVVSGMVERGNILRRILLQGIKKQVIKSHVIAEAIDDNDAKLAQAEKQASDDPALQPDAIRTARQQNLHLLDDADDTAEHLCHRLVYDEEKLRSLTEALRGHTQ